MVEYLTIFGDVVSYQSAPELKFIKLCESLGIKILNGPVLDYKLNGKWHKYNTDFLIFQDIGKRIIEIKRKHKWWFMDLQTGRLKEKVKSTIAYSKLYNYLPYKIVFGDNYGF